MNVTRLSSRGLTKLRLESRVTFTKFTKKATPQYKCLFFDKKVYFCQKLEQYVSNSRYL